MYGVCLILYNVRVCWINRNAEQSQWCTIYEGIVKEKKVNVLDKKITECNF